MQVVFLGLDTVIPLMTGDLLHFPKLIRAFFSLIAYMLEVYPERVASLPGGCHTPLWESAAPLAGCARILQGRPESASEPVPQCIWKAMSQIVQCCVARRY